ncbi:hypothetical protein TKK_0013014 [Trichogramma kaykai]
MHSKVESQTKDCRAEQELTLLTYVTSGALKEDQPSLFARLPSAREATNVQRSSSVFIQRDNSNVTAKRETDAAKCFSVVRGCVKGGRPMLQSDGL